METWFTLTDTEHGYVKIQLVNEDVYIHCDIYEWSHSLFREYKKYLRTVLLPQLKALDIEVVWSVYDKENIKGQRFAKMFGFTVEQIDKVEVDGVVTEYVLMSQEL